MKTTVYKDGNVVTSVTHYDPTHSCSQCSPTSNGETYYTEERVVNSRPGIQTTSYTIQRDPSVYSSSSHNSVSYDNSTNN